MSNVLDNVKRGLKYAEPVVHALQVIQTITGYGGKDAAAALKAIDAVVTTTLEGIAKGIDPEAIVKELDQLSADIATNDANADSALDAKFRGDTTP